VTTADAEPMNNSINECADLSFAPRLACFRWHDDGASVGVMIVGERSLPDAITSNSSIKSERPCSTRARNGRRARLFGPGILRVGRVRGQCQHKRDCQSRHHGLLLLQEGPTRGDTTEFRSPSGGNWAARWPPARRPPSLGASAPPCVRVRSVPAKPDRSFTDRRRFYRSSEKSGSACGTSPSRGA
jgi:hypothetical protein